MAKEAENIEQNETETQSPFDTKVNDETRSINRTELMEKTGKELAKIALQYTTLKEGTLSKLSKAELCDIILSKGESREQPKERKGRATRTLSDSEAIIETIITVIESFKMKRENEPLSPIAKQIFKNNATNIVDEKVKDEAITSHGVSTSVAIITGGFLILDGLVGLQNIPTLFSKIKSKFNAKSNTK